MRQIVKSMVVLGRCNGNKRMLFSSAKVIQIFDIRIKEAMLLYQILEIRKMI